jgi:hypothetical protein
MTHAELLTAAEIETMGPPVPEEIRETDVPTGFLCDLTLKHVAEMPEPTTNSIADRLHLSRSLTEELLQYLYREKLIEVKLQSAVGSTRYSMLDHGWDRVTRLRSQCGYSGPAPVSLADYTFMIRQQAGALRAATMSDVRNALSDLVLPDSLLQTLGCVVNSRRSLFLTGPPGTGKTAISERVNRTVPGVIWIPYAIEIDGQVIRVFDAHNHRPANQLRDAAVEFDRRWICIERPFVIVGGELTLNETDLSWNDISRFYEAPFQMKANGGTLVIDDFGRQRVEPHELLNRWILPLERRIDFLTLHNGKKIEVPFEQLVIFSTNLDETDLVDEAFLRRMGYRARIEPPTPDAYVQIFRNVAASRGIEVTDSCYYHILAKYDFEKRQMKACEPRDLIARIEDLCMFENRQVSCTNDLLDMAWRNYFGSSHSF